jgi:hypothetical protein
VIGLAGLAHDGDDLLDPRGVGRVMEPLVPRRTPRVETGQRGRRTPATRRIEKLERGHGTSLVRTAAIRLIYRAKRSALLLPWDCGTLAPRRDWFVANPVA